MKVIRCRTCKKVILKSRLKHVSKEKIMKSIRRHYKKYHPKRFKGFIKKALRTKRKKGIIGTSEKKALNILQLHVDRFNKKYNRAIKLRE